MYVLQIILKEFSTVKGFTRPHLQIITKSYVKVAPRNYFKPTEARTFRNEDEKPSLIYPNALDIAACIVYKLTHHLTQPSNNREDYA